MLSSQEEECITGGKFGAPADTKKMTTPSRKLQDTDEASLTVFTIINPFFMESFENA